MAMDRLDYVYRLFQARGPNLASSPGHTHLSMLHAACNIERWVWPGDEARPNHRLTGSFCVQTQTINSMCWRSCRVHAVGVGLHTPRAASLICTCALLARTSLTMPRIRAMPSSHAPCNRCQELIQRALHN